MGLVAGPGAAQQALPVPDTAVLAGTLLVSGIPPDSGTVVLHRVTPEVSGPVDSVRVGRDGSFRFVLPAPPVPGSGEVYFASHRYDGFLYFGPPLGSQAPFDAPYQVEAYPTREAPAAGLELPVAVRNLFIEEGPEGWRATDLFEIGNDSAHTWIPASPDAVVWRHRLPPEAFAVRVAEGDTGPGTVAFEDGELRVRSAIPPAGRLVVVQYDLPRIATTIPLEGRTGALELLVREPAPPLRVRGLASEPAIQLEPGSIYRRWHGTDLRAGMIGIEIGEEPAISPAWGAVLLALVLAALGGWLILRRGASRAADVAGLDRRALVLEIARLDELEAQAEGKGSDAERARRRERRAALLARLESLEGPGFGPPDGGDGGAA